MTYLPKKHLILPSFLILSPIMLNIKNFSKENKENTPKFKKFTLKDDISGKTILTVSKKVSKHWDKDNINVYQNEKKWLNLLKNTDVIAKPVHFDDENRIITTEFVGESINKGNIPNNWKEQRDHICSTLKKFNCRHNDIKPNELIVHNNKIKLIDFGWANDFDKPNPHNFPSCLGAEFKCNLKDKEYDDKCSFNKSINYIKNKKN